LALLVLLALGALAGCGESAPASSATRTSSAAAVNVSATSKQTADAVAMVSGTPISTASYEHWLAVDRALGAGATASHKALGFLISSTWVRREAADRGLAVSAAQVSARLAQLKRQSFSQPGSLARFLAKSRESEADLLGRVRIELLESAVVAKITAGASPSRHASVLASFQRTFQQSWKSRTTCRVGYVMEDCSEYRGKPEAQLAPTPGATTSAKRSSNTQTSSAASSSSSASGEVYSTPGGMSIGSPAFERNGAIPAQYTCDGADTSPPLEWQNVPAKAAALVLFVIDDSATGPASGIRWVVGDINPNTKGVAAGKTPEGGIVGADTQGRSGYGGICPAGGKTSTIEFVLYALKKKIPLSANFTPAVAESEYGAGKDLLGPAAVTYAVYHRS
jgi:hypothetical protein